MTVLLTRNARTRTPRTGSSRTGNPVAVPAALLAVALTAFGWVALVDPNEPGHYPVCPLRRLTGLWCPGCGGLRSVHALAHGDLVRALTDNAPAVVGGAVCAVLFTVRTVRSLCAAHPSGRARTRRTRGSTDRVRRRAGRARRTAPGRLPRALLWSAAALTAAYTVVRNLPCGAWLHP